MDSALNRAFNAQFEDELLEIKRELDKERREKEKEEEEQKKSRT